MSNPFSKKSSVHSANFRTRHLLGNPLKAAMANGKIINETENNVRYSFSNLEVLKVEYPSIDEGCKTDKFRHRQRAVSVLQTRLAGAEGWQAGVRGTFPLNDHPSTLLTGATVSTNSILGECGKQ